MEYVLGVAATALLGTSFVLQQGAAQRVPSAEFLRLRLVADLLRQPRWLAGIGTMICGWRAHPPWPPSTRCATASTGPVTRAPGQ